MPRTRAELRGLPAAARIFHDAGALPLRAGRRACSRWCARSAGGARDRLPVPPAGAGARRPHGRPTSQLFATPVINLFERDCNVIEIDPRRPRQVLHADRTRPRDFEIYRVTARRGRRPRGAGGAICRRSSASARTGAAAGSVRPSGGRAGRPRTSGGRAGRAPPTPATTSSWPSPPGGRPDAAPARAARHRARSAPTATCRSSTTRRR